MASADPNECTRGSAEVMTGASIGRLYGCGRRGPRVLPRLAVLPNSIGPDEIVFSIMREPKEVRLAEGEPDGDAGDSVTSGLRLL